MSSSVRKHTFGHVRPAKIQTSLHIPAVNRIFTGNILDSQGCKISSYRQWRLIRLCRCASWFESSLGTHVRRYIFSHWSPICILLLTWLFSPIKTGEFLDWIPWSYDQGPAFQNEVVSKCFAKATHIFAAKILMYWKMPWLQQLTSLSFITGLLS